MIFYQISVTDSGVVGEVEIKSVCDKHRGNGGKQLHHHEFCHKDYHAQIEYRTNELACQPPEHSLCGSFGEFFLSISNHVRVIPFDQRVSYNISIIHHTAHDFKTFYVMIRENFHL